MAPEPFEPRILAFLCTWCSYRAADEIGKARHAYPAAIRIVRVPCSGRVDPQWVLMALDQGADGVLILGCPPGNCHYRNGNLQALKRFTLLQRLLHELGIDSARLRLDWVAAGEGEKLLAIFNNMVESIRTMTPLVHPESVG
ncbi:MAG TPA: methyl-viologen-reducing hydrogenase subunit delta [Syntrophobacteraceae bacterium]|nr:methyl-viologen-reducing hydrogenase subunit delta [Syntrophobacteraceae bacterium]